MAAASSSGSRLGEHQIDSGQFAAPTAPPAGAKKGGDLDVLAASDVDYIDPGAAYYQFTYMVDSATQRQLEAWAPGDVEQPTPHLATDGPDGQPTTARRSRTSSSRDIKYSPPVNRDGQVRRLQVRDRAGAAAGRGQRLRRTCISATSRASRRPQKAAQADPTDGLPTSAGSRAPDDTTLVIKLDKPSSLGVIGALSLPIGSPVPREYAKQFDAENPSTYGEHQVATGPYMIENDEDG